MSIKNHLVLAALFASATLSAGALAEKLPAKAGTAATTSAPPPAKSKPVAEPTAKKKKKKEQQDFVKITIKEVGRTGDPDDGGERPATRPDTKKR